VKAGARIGVVVLAAGAGTRFGPGGRKLLQPWRGRTLIEHVLATIVSARQQGLVGDGYVVHSPDGDEIRDLAIAHGFDAIRTSDPARGMSESLKAAFTVLEVETTQAVSAVLLFLGDQPLVPIAAIAALVESAGPSPFALVRPRYREAPDAPGHPVLIGRAHWHLVAETAEDRGLEPVLVRHDLRWTMVDVPGQNPDVDTPGDLEALR
jgi:CTP:molybdopterin cytidylyltransferase MocA